DTVANIFGSATIFADRPFTINDRIKIDGYDGIIREIGLRSTRLETRDGPVVTIPNSIFTGSPVENISVGEKGRRVVSELGLTYDTTADGMQRGMDILHEIAAANEGVGDDVNISFSSYGDSAMVIRCAYFVNPGASFRGVQSEFNMEVLKRFGEAGLDFAYPTQTIYTISSNQS
ncbi:MAG: mechanosensitive ion channel family protein, partial [Acidobacteriota bacterium]